ncbi:hypothetical protein LXL04_016410 [Taraxacum kok-saghyz]
MGTPINLIEIQTREKKIGKKRLEYPSWNRDREEQRTTVRRRSGRWRRSNGDLVGFEECVNKWRKKKIKVKRRVRNVDAVLGKDVDRLPVRPGDLMTMDFIEFRAVDCQTNKNITKPKLVWDNATVLMFLELALLELTKGNRPGSHFTKEGWSNLELGMKQKTGKVYTQKQVKNKWENLKKDWKIYDRLTRRESGIGGTRSLLDASPEWWEEKIRVTTSLFFRSFPTPSFGKRKKGKDVGNDPSNKSKISNFEEELDVVLEALSSKSTQNIPPPNPIPTLLDSMKIVVTFPGFSEGSRAYSEALRLFIKKEKREAFMFPTTNEAKMDFLLMDSDSDSNSDDNQEPWVEEDIELKQLCGLALKGIIIGHNMRMTRTPVHTSEHTGNKFMLDILNGNNKQCYDMFRMHVPVFRQLCTTLVSKYKLKQTRHVSIEDSVGIFLVTLAHGCSNRFLQEIFNHSGETVHRHFYAVLAAVLKMSADLIKPAGNYNDVVPNYILNNRRYYPMFKDCIGAIDGTHVRASVGRHEEAKFIGRKGYATLNIMVVCDFDMCFTFVWAGWEGTAHDTRIFNEALRRNELQFPHPRGDQYYVVDAGYPNTNGYLAPYKARWALLRDMDHNFTFEHQVQIMIASMAAHNYIRRTDMNDEAFNEAQDESYIPGIGGTSDEAREEGLSTRRTIADGLYTWQRDEILSRKR